MPHGLPCALKKLLKKINNSSKLKLEKNTVGIEIQKKKKKKKKQDLTIVISYP